MVVSIFFRMESRRYASPIRFPWRNGTCGVLASGGTQSDIRRFYQEILFVVMGVGGVGIDAAFRRKIEREAGKRGDVRHRARREEALDGMTVGGDQQMGLESVEVAPFACRVAPVSFVPNQAASSDADVVTDRDREAVDHVFVGSVLMLPAFGQLIEQLSQSRLDGVQTPIESTLAQHGRDVCRRIEQASCGFEIAAEVERGDERGGHHLGVGHQTLWIVTMPRRSEEVVTEAVESYDCVVHRDDSCGKRAHTHSKADLDGRS